MLEREIKITRKIKRKGSIEITSEVTVKGERIGYFIIATQRTHQSKQTKSKPSLET
jgi:hypothetical protein